MKTYDEAGFYTTLGREMCAALDGVLDEVYGDDAPDVFWPVLGREMSPAALAVVTDEQVGRLLSTFRNFFESEEIEECHVRQIISRTLRHWPPQGTR